MKELIDFAEWKEDAVGLWMGSGYELCCFPTPESIKEISARTVEQSSNLFVAINQQFFLNPMSSQFSKNFVENTESIYQMVPLNMRGPMSLSVRGLLYRKYPDKFVVRHVNLWCDPSPPPNNNSTPNHH